MYLNKRLSGPPVSDLPGRPDARETSETPLDQRNGKGLRSLTSVRNRVPGRNEVTGEATSVQEETETGRTEEEHS